MITIIGRRLIIPDCDRVLGVTEDANTKIKIKLSSDTVERYFPDSANTDNVGITLVMEYEDGAEFSSVAFTKSDNGVHEGYVNLVGVTKVGLLNARALLTYSEETKDGDTVSTVTTSMQTEEDYFYISEDIEAGDINENGSTLAAWSQTLKDIKEETKNLDTAVTTAINAASSASGSAENANKSELAAEKWATYAEGYKSEALMAKSEAESAKDAAVSAKDEAAGLVGKYSKHLPDYNNPHMVTAEQVGAYTKEEVDKKLENIDVDVDLSEYVKKEEVFEAGSFGWTDFAYDVEAADWDETYSLSDNQITGGGAKFTIHCKGKTLGFDFALDNTSASYIEINGILYTSSSGSIPLTYMETDVIVYCSLAMFEFSNMTQQSIKGVSELESQIGDIDTALDSILDIQESFIPMAVLPGEEEVVS